MATRSRIGYYDYDTGCIKSVYCHYDGYPEYNGVLLISYYDSLEKAKQLVSLGSISSLGQCLEYDEDHRIGTRDYHRWRGEPIEIETDYGISDYSNCAFDCGEEYAYLFIGGRWVVLAEGQNIYTAVSDLVEPEKPGKKAIISLA